LLAILNKLEAAPQTPVRISSDAPAPLPQQQTQPPASPAPLRAAAAFEPGAVEPSADVLCQLEGVAAQLKLAGAKSILVVGYTDSSRLRGGLREHFEDNVALSRARAAAVARVLERGGVDRRMIQTYGLGAAQPIAGNDTPENRAKNRRVEIVGW